MWGSERKETMWKLQLTDIVVMIIVFQCDDFRFFINRKKLEQIAYQYALFVVLFYTVDVLKHLNVSSSFKFHFD